MPAALLRSVFKLLAGAVLIAPALIVCGQGDWSAHAQGAPPSAVTPPSATGKPPAETVPQAITAEVTGFRSARFGMTDDQVREAIKRDFDIDAKDVKRLRNEVQKTDILAVQVENLVPGSGTSIVFYIFGYKSKRLIHVNVVWGKLAQQTVPPASLVNTGTILQNYFKDLGLAAGPVGASTTQITLFQGYDEKKRAIQLLLEISPLPPTKTEAAKPGDAKGAKTDGKAAPQAAPKPTPQASGSGGAKADTSQYVATSLKLSYIESLSNPDIYTVPKGKF